MKVYYGQDVNLKKLPEKDLTPLNKSPETPRIFEINYKYNLTY